MISFMDQQRDEYGVEPICRQLSIAPSTYYEAKTRQRDPNKLPPRHRRDQQLCREIRRFWDDHFQVYGARKVWHQLKHEGFLVARCTIEWLMRQLGLRGIIRGSGCKTTRQDESLPCPEDLVDRQFYVAAPNQLWVADLTYVSTWQGFAYTAFVIMHLLGALSVGVL